MGALFIYVLQGECLINLLSVLSINLSNFLFRAYVALFGRRKYTESLRALQKGIVSCAADNCLLCIDSLKAVAVNVTLLFLVVFHV